MQTTNSEKSNTSTDSTPKRNKQRLPPLNITFRTLQNVGQRHALIAIIVDAKQYFVSDLQSVNGTLEKNKSQPITRKQNGYRRNMKEW